MRTYQEPAGTNEELCIAAAEAALQSADCPSRGAEITKIARLLLPSLRVFDEELVDPRDASSRLPLRVVRVVDGQGNVRVHGARASEPMTVRELVVEQHNQCTHRERVRRSAQSADWMAFRWTAADIR